jgi:chorismate synthase
MDVLFWSEVMIRFTTACESHGEGIFVVLEGIPAGLTVVLKI